MMVCDSPTSINNRVIQSRLETTIIDSKIREIVEFYSSKRLPFLWMVGPRDALVDLTRHLEEHGFVKDGVPGMAIDLNQLKVPDTLSGLNNKGGR